MYDNDEELESYVSVNDEDVIQETFRALKRVLRTNSIFWISEVIAYEYRRKDHQ